MVNFRLNEKTLQINNDNEEVLKIEMISSTVTNKFFIITNFIENLSKTFKDFDEWFLNFLIEYSSDVERYIIIEKNIPIIKKYVDEYLKIKNIDTKKFVDETKAKKSSILFNVEEIEAIIRLSCYLKIYALFFNSENLKLDTRLHKKIYNEFASDVLKNTEVVTKIFNLISTKTFRYNLTDKYMWDYIKMIQCKTIDVHIIEIFNFIMNSILVLCEEDRNPIIYFSTVVQESINWFLRSVYKSQIIYDDTISTEDIHGSTVDNLKTYTYNDTLGRLKGIAFEQIYDNLERNSIILFTNNYDNTDQSLVDFQNRVEKIEYISPLCESLVYPILSKITSIPYLHFKTLSPDHAMVLSVYTQNLLRKVFNIIEYKNLFSLLSYYPKKDIAVATTYKVKAVEEFINGTTNVDNFFGFQTKLILYNMLGYFVGRISRVEFVNIFDGAPLIGIPLSKIESEMIQFYTLFFGSKFEKELKYMNELMQKDF